MPDSAIFTVIFERLKKTLLANTKTLIVATEESGRFSLDVPASVKYPAGLFFGAVNINKNYVSYHLMPVYIFPDLLDGISARLKKRIQGKSCFNFRVMDDDLFAELGHLTEAGAARCRQEYLV